MLDWINNIDKARATHEGKEEIYKRIAKIASEMRRSLTPCDGTKPERLIVLAENHRIPYAWKHNKDLENFIYTILDEMAPEIFRAAELEFERRAKVQRLKADALQAQIDASIIIPED